MFNLRLGLSAASISACRAGVVRTAMLHGKRGWERRGRNLFHDQAAKTVSDEHDGPAQVLVGLAEMRKPVEQLAGVIVDVELGGSQGHAGVVPEQHYTRPGATLWKQVPRPKSAIFMCPGEISVRFAIERVQSVNENDTGRE